MHYTIWCSALVPVFLVLLGSFFRVWLIQPILPPSSLAALRAFRFGVVWVPSPQWKVPVGLKMSFNPTII